MTTVGKRFRFMKVIAEGGFGKVYLAEMMSADGFSRIVAVKVLHSKWSSHDEVVMRTRDEARLLGLIRHQHIVKVEDLTSINGLCAIVMEYLEGLDMKCVSKYQNTLGLAIPNATIFESMVAVTSALDAAYNGKPLQSDASLHVIHRDIKPSNIFLTTNGNVKVLDFGTARANFAEREAKTMELSFGSQGYMAPERLLGEPDTPAADIFSLGVTLYELLAQEPFGRIVPRAAKLTAKVVERVESLELSGDDAWVSCVKETLTSMLCAEPGDRPTADALIDIFDDLARRADGDGLRKFCRTTVAEAKRVEPVESPDDDPLFGRTVPVDVSGVFSNGQSVQPEMEPTNSTQTTERVVGIRRTEDTETEHDSFVVSKPRGLFTPVAIGAGILLLLGGGYTLFGGGAVPAEQTPIEDAKVEAVEAVEQHPSGLEIKSPSNGEPNTRASAVTLTVPADTQATVAIRNRANKFNARWEASGTVSLGELSAGTYVTNLTVEGQGKIRKKTFEIQAGKRCSFTFNFSARHWDGNCE
jgi:serine/threonine protein kinase